MLGHYSALEDSRSRDNISPTLLRAEGHHSFLERAEMPGGGATPLSRVDPPPISHDRGTPHSSLLLWGKDGATRCCDITPSLEDIGTPRQLLGSQRLFVLDSLVQDLVCMISRDI